MSIAQMILGSFAAKRVVWRRIALCALLVLFAAASLLSVLADLGVFSSSLAP